MLVEFRGLNGERLWVNPEHVMFVTNSEEDNHGVLVMTNGLEVPVFPTPEETAARIEQAAKQAPRPAQPAPARASTPRPNQRR